MLLNLNLRKRRSSESEVSDLDSIHWNPADLSVRKQPTHLATPPLVEVWRTTAEIPYWWRVTNQNWVVLLIGRNKFPSRQDQSEALPRSGYWRVTSTEFPRSFLRRLWRGNQWWCCNLDPRLVVSLLDKYIQRILSRFLDDTFSWSGLFCQVAWLARLSFNHEVDFSCV